MHKEYFQNNQPKIELVCCYLNNHTENLKKNGITRYIQFLNDSMNNSSHSGFGLKKKMDEIDQSFKENIVPLVPKFTHTKKICRTINCYEYAMESQEFSGYCERCYRSYERSLQQERADIEREQRELERFQDINRKLDMERQMEQDRLDSITKKHALERQRELERLDAISRRTNDMKRLELDQEKENERLNRIAEATRAEAMARRSHVEKLDLIEKQAELSRQQEEYRLGN